MSLALQVVVDDLAVRHTRQENCDREGFRDLPGESGGQGIRIERAIPDPAVLDGQGLTINRRNPAAETADLEVLERHLADPFQADGGAAGAIDGD